MTRPTEDEIVTALRDGREIIVTDYEGATRIGGAFSTFNKES